MLLYLEMFRVDLDQVREQVRLTHRQLRHHLPLGFQEVVVGGNHRLLQLILTHPQLGAQTHTVAP